MGRADYYADGDYNAICSMCGFKFKASELTKNWQGMYRCPRCQEPRQPQDFVRAIPDIQTPPWVQPPAVVFAATCFPCDQTAIPNLAIPNCVIPNNISPACDEVLPPPFITLVVATGTAPLDMEGITAVVVTSTNVMSTVGVLSLAGQPVDIEAECTPCGRSAIPHRAIPNCVIPNNIDAGCNLASPLPD